MEKNLTTSVYTFSKIIEQNFLYIDKTKFIYDIVKNHIGTNSNRCLIPTAHGRQERDNTLIESSNRIKDAFKDAKVFQGNPCVVWMHAQGNIPNYKSLAVEAKYK